MYAKMKTRIFKFGSLKTSTKITLIILAFLILWFGIGELSKKNYSSVQKNYSPNNIIVLARKEIAQEFFKNVIAYGRIDRDRIEVISEINSHVEKIIVSEGSEVGKGQNVLELLNGIRVPAPIRGRLDKISVKKGEIVFAERSPLFAVVSNEKLDAILYLAVNDIHLVSVGQEATIEADEKKYKGKVYFISQGVDPKNNTFEVGINIFPEKEAEKLFHNRSVKINIKTVKHSESFFIPTSALTLNKEEKIIVKYIKDDNTVAQAEVEILETLSDGVWVTGKGLPANPLIIIRGGDFLKEGEKAQYQLE